MNLFANLPKKLLGPGPAPSAVLYKLRLNRLWAQMEDDSVAILVSNPERTRSSDTEHPYRQHSDIVYLTGFPEPDSVLVVTKFKGQQNVIMFVQPKDRENEIWTGIREGVDGAKAKYFANEAYPIADFNKRIGKLIAKASKVYYRFQNNHRLDAQFRKLWQEAQKPLLNPDDIIHELRLFKSGHELDLIRHASAISAEAHKQAMIACRPGMTEYQLQAVLEFVFRACGATAPSYGSIVASGNNAVILHYTRNSDALRKGDLVLIDAACEYGTGLNGGYASDITRCFPVSGKFTKPQREIYELVLEAQMAALAKCQPGVRLIDVHEEAEKVLTAGLVKLGILPRSALKTEEQKKAVAAKKAAAKKKSKKSKAPAKKGKAALELDDFFMHGTSHWMGIDVHDVGLYDATDGSRSGDRRNSRKHRMLEPGMVFTVEPGLYFDKDDKRVPECFRGIGIRIEDDVVITETGHEVLTPDVPKTVKEIEALMRR